MSMLNIPDIKPDINITLEDSVNLLLTSIAEEEISLSKLMNAEKDKILYILDKYKNNAADVGDILAVNSSVDKTIIDLIKMQMLLQFKLENVKELMPPDKPCPPCCPTDGGCRKSRCLLTGKDRGEVSNQPDEFYCGRAILDAFVSSDNYKDNVICYYVRGECDSLLLEAYANNIKIECPHNLKCGKVKICGGARLARISGCKKTVANANFELCVWNNKTGENGFQMIIKSCENHAIIHNSGFVETETNPCGKGLSLHFYPE